MNFIATVVERVLTAVTWLAMHVVIISERWRRRLPRRIRRWGGSVKRSAIVVRHALDDAI
jgi:hypothetical protein